jgi:hypothetical protein
MFVTLETANRITVSAPTSSLSQDPSQVGPVLQSEHLCPLCCEGETVLNLILRGVVISRCGCVLMFFVLGSGFLERPLGNNFCLDTIRMMGSSSIINSHWT